MGTVSETSRKTLNTPTFKLYGSQKKKRKRKCLRKIFEEIIVENFPNMGKELSPKSRKCRENPIQDKAKEEHVETHINQTDKI